MTCSLLNPPYSDSLCTTHSGNKDENVFYLYELDEIITICEFGSSSSLVRCGLARKALKSKTNVEATENKARGSEWMRIR
jgi:hypothetical protein